MTVNTPPLPVSFVVVYLSLLTDLLLLTNMLLTGGVFVVDTFVVVDKQVDVVDKHDVVVGCKPVDIVVIVDRLGLFFLLLMLLLTDVLLLTDWLLLLLANMLLGDVVVVVVYSLIYRQTSRRLCHGHVPVGSQGNHRLPQCFQASRIHRRLLDRPGWRTLPSDGLSSQTTQGVPLPPLSLFLHTLFSSRSGEDASSV